MRTRPDGAQAPVPDKETRISPATASGSQDNGPWLTENLRQTRPWHAVLIQDRNFVLKQDLETSEAANRG